MNHPESHSWQGAEPAPPLLPPWAVVLLPPLLPPWAVVLVPPLLPPVTVVPGPLLLLQPCAIAKSPTTKALAVVMEPPFEQRIFKRRP